MNNQKIDSEFVVTKEAMATAGCVSYWRAGGEVSIEATARAWTDAGLDPALLRKPAEDVTALRRAVAEQQDRHRLVRAVAKGQWAIVDEIVAPVVEGQPALPPTYSTVVIVRFENGVPAYDVVTSADAVKVIAEVGAAYHRQQGLYQPEDITSWLVKLAHGANSVTLRDSGGVYFVPRPKMDFWNKAANAIETATHKNVRVFRIPAMKNAEAVAAIVDAVTAEAAQLAAAMETELLATGDDAIGKRALESRKTEAQALLDKVAAYEELLGLQIAVRERVETLQANLAIASLTEAQAA